MTTTTMDHWVSDYAVGRQHGDFTGRNSTPTVGAMNDRDAQMYWRVIRGGAIIHREHKILDFQWLGLNADQVRGMAVDREGNAGDWVSYTFSVTANTAADWVRYVDTGGNDTTGDGSLGNPWATGAKAVTEAQSALTSGQVGVIFFADDQTHSFSATAFDGSDSTACLLRFVRRGNGTNRPDFSFAANVVGFAPGKRGVCHIDGCDITGAHTTDAAAAFNLERTGGVSADQSAWDFMAVDCDVTNFGRGLYCNWGLTAADRDDGGNDFIALQNVSFAGTRWFHVYGMHHTNRSLFREVTFGTHTAFSANPFRVFSVGRMYCEDVDFATNDGGSMRLSVGVGSTDDDAMRECTLVRVTMLGTNAGLNSITIQPDAAMSGVGIVRDVRLVDCELREAQYKVEADVSGNNGLNTNRIDFLECWSCASQFLLVGGAASTSHTHSRIRVCNCGVTQMNYAGGQFVTISGAVGRYAAGCFDFVGCWKLWGTGNSEVRMFYNATGMNVSELASVLTESDYNHLGKGDANTNYWVRNSFTTLATWQGATTFDDHSSLTYSTTFDLTNNGSTPANADFRLTADTGPLAGTGYPLPLGVSVDADGYLRSATTPDAGPYEYGASTLPDDPEIGGGGGGTAILRTGLRLGLRLGL